MVSSVNLIFITAAVTYFKTGKFLLSLDIIYVIISTLRPILICKESIFLHSLCKWIGNISKDTWTLHGFNRFTSRCVWRNWNHLTYYWNQTQHTKVVANQLVHHFLQFLHMSSNKCLNCRPLFSWNEHKYGDGQWNSICSFS